MTPSRFLLKFVLTLSEFHFYFLDLDFKFSTQFISATLVSALTIFQVSWIIFIDLSILHLLSLLVILWWQNDWLTDCATCWRSESRCLHGHRYRHRFRHRFRHRRLGHLSYSLLFLFLISFFINTYIRIYIDAFYELLSIPIKVSRLQVGRVLELTVKSFVYKSCQMQKIGCYENGSHKYSGGVFEWFKVQIYV